MQHKIVLLVALIVAVFAIAATARTPQQYVDYDYDYYTTEDSDDALFNQYLTTPGFEATPETFISKNGFTYAIDFKQCDSRWSTVPIGTTGGTSCKIGCLVNSVSNSVYARHRTMPGSTTEANPLHIIPKLEFTSGGAFMHASVSKVCTGCSYITATNGKNAGTTYAQLKQWLTVNDYTVVIGMVGSAGTANSHWVTLWQVKQNADGSVLI